jgi:hypothetical protein
LESPVALPVQQGGWIDLIGVEEVQRDQRGIEALLDFRGKVIHSPERGDLSPQGP